MDEAFRETTTIKYAEDSGFGKNELPSGRAATACALDRSSTETRLGNVQSRIITFPVVTSDWPKGLQWRLVPGNMTSMLGIPHPYLTPQLPGIGGEIKQFIEDFHVEEVPLYQPSGVGEHCFIEIEKTDLATRDAIDHMARGLNVQSGRFGYAGLKDRKGITRQFLSVSQADEDRIRQLQLTGIKVLRVARHKNKLRIGHLRGNRFRIRVRGVGADAERRVKDVLEVIVEKGLPKIFLFFSCGK